MDLILGPLKTALLVRSEREASAAPPLGLAAPRDAAPPEPAIAIRRRVALDVRADPERSHPFAPGRAVPASRRPSVLAGSPPGHRYPPLRGQVR
jgi:hypothetical protein